MRNESRYVLALLFWAIPAFCASLSVTPASLNLGNVNASAQNSQQLTIKNTGSVPVSVTAVNISGGSGKFTYSGIALPKSLAPNATTTVTVTFAPTAGGALSASLTLTTNPAATISPSSVSLSGIGVSAPSLTTNVTGWRFGNVYDSPSLLSTTYWFTSTLTNPASSSGNISVSGITLSGSAAYSASSNPSTPFILTPGQTATVTITYSPDMATSTAGYGIGQASVANNGAGSPLVISFDGTGIHWVTLSWTASTTPGVTYNVYKATVSGSYGAAIATGIAGTSYNDTSTSVSGATYYYVVKAFDGTNESVSTNEVVAVIPTP
jgi:hypothetical protein